jgi:formylglycine-generating enzyme required for sulfatase activity
MMKHMLSPCLVFCLLSMPLLLGQTSDEKKAGDRMTLKIKDVEYAFRWCPAGKFQMGSSAEEQKRSLESMLESIPEEYREKLRAEARQILESLATSEFQHQVTLSKGFWMLETEVTQGMWESVMGNNPSRFEGAKLPVESVSWNDCQGYVKKLNDMKVAPKGFKFSLPTEAQWEYACRAGTTTAYSFGDSLTQQQANFGSGQAKDVGGYAANAWGLKDMHGNVWEWCLDWYGNYLSGAVTDPTVASRGSFRVLRGGSWGRLAESCRSAFRRGYVPGGRYGILGLRLSLVSE